MNWITQEANKRAGQMVAWRREFHMYPELGHQEVETARRVAGVLRAMGIPAQTGVGGTGVVADIGGDGPIIALRAELDALPVPEESGAEYSSQNPGVMHACGHDAHMAMLLGAASILKERESQLKGKVRLIFQQAEEMEGGARDLIAAGGLGDPKPQAIFALHIWPDLPWGVLHCSPGPVMAAVDRFEITVLGKGGHGAAPHQAVDALVAGAQIVTGLQTIISRCVDPQAPAVLTVGEFHSGVAKNVISGKAYLAGSVRLFDLDQREVIRRRMEEIATGMAASLGARAEVVYIAGYPPTVNPTQPALDWAQAASAVMSVSPLGTPMMTSEDFSLYFNEIPGAYALLGAGMIGPDLQALHHPAYLAPEELLPLGAGALVSAAWFYLGEEASS